MTNTKTSELAFAQQERAAKTRQYVASKTTKREQKRVNTLLIIGLVTLLPCLVFAVWQGL